MVERLGPKLQVMEFMGNFYDDVQVLSQVIIYLLYRGKFWQIITPIKYYTASFLM